MKLPGGAGWGSGSGSGSGFDGGGLTIQGTGFAAPQGSTACRRDAPGCPHRRSVFERRCGGVPRQSTDIPPVACGPLAHLSPAAALARARVDRHIASKLARASGRLPQRKPEDAVTAVRVGCHALKRTRGGFYSPKQPANVFTRRVINWLYERALIDYDDPNFPTQTTLTKSGMAQAAALVEQARISVAAP